MSAKSPVLIFNNGVRMPALGLGAWRSSPEQTAEAVATALATGYRLIDTAAGYFNERQVGEGYRRSGLPRDEVFITTKVWISDFGYEPALRAVESSRRKLELEQIDLILLHWPVPHDFADTIEAYRALEKLLSDGVVRAIGVSNFSAQHLDDLMAQREVMPALNQIELNPSFTQTQLRAANAERGIITQSWSPLGGVSMRAEGDGDPARLPLQSQAVAGLAEQLSKTPAQVILRWHLQHGLSAIPKSVHSERIAENFNLFDFELSDDQMKTIDALDTGERSGPDPELVDTRLFTMKSEP